MKFYASTATHVTQATQATQETYATQVAKTQRTQQIELILFFMHETQPSTNSIHPEILPCVNTQTSFQLSLAVRTVRSLRPLRMCIRTFRTVLPCVSLRCVRFLRCLRYVRCGCCVKFHARALRCVRYLRCVEMETRLKSLNQLGPW